MGYDIYILRELKVGSTWQCIEDRETVIERDGTCTYVPVDIEYRRDYDLYSLLSGVSDTDDAYSEPAKHVFCRTPRGIPEDCSQETKCCLDRASKWLLEKYGVSYATFEELNTFADNIIPKTEKEDVDCAFFKYTISKFLNTVDNAQTINVDLSYIRQGWYSYKDFPPTHKRIIWWFGF